MYNYIFYIKYFLRSNYTFDIKENSDAKVTPWLDSQMLLLTPVEPQAKATVLTMKPELCGRTHRSQFQLIGATLPEPREVELQNFGCRALGEI